MLRWKLARQEIYYKTKCCEEKWYFSLIFLNVYCPQIYTEIEKKKLKTTLLKDPYKSGMIDHYSRLPLF